LQKYYEKAIINGYFRHASLPAKKRVAVIISGTGELQQRYWVIKES